MPQTPAGILLDARDATAGGGGAMGGGTAFNSAANSGKRTQRFPSRRAFRLNQRLGVDAVLGDPAPDFLHADRAVLLAIHSYDFIHNTPFWFQLPLHKFHDGFGGWPGKSASARRNAVWLGGFGRLRLPQQAHACDQRPKPGRDE